MKIMVAIAALACLAAFTGCAGFYSAPVVPPGGWVFSDISAPVTIVPNSIGAKEGKAMTQNVLGAVAWGDASITTAAANGGIKSVEQVDYHFKNILGVYSEFTTIVHGQ